MIPFLIFFASPQDTVPASRPAPPPVAGEEAPDFALKDQSGKEVRLSTFRGKGKVLIAFYPKDDTPG